MKDTQHIKRAVVWALLIDGLFTATNFGALFLVTTHSKFVELYSLMWVYSHRPTEYFFGRLLAGDATLDEPFGGVRLMIYIIACVGQTALLAIAGGLIYRLMAKRMRSKGHNQLSL